LEKQDEIMLDILHKIETMEKKELSAGGDKTSV